MPFINANAGYVRWFPTRFDADNAIDQANHQHPEKALLMCEDVGRGWGWLVYYRRNKSRRAPNQIAEQWEEMR